MSKQNIYGDSFKPATEPKSKDEILEALQVRKVERERTRKLGLMLREERGKNQTLQSRITRLEDENRRLKEALANKVR